LVTIARNSTAEPKIFRERSSAEEIGRDKVIEVALFGDGEAIPACAGLGS
jgi:hypothetical protein